MSFPQGAAAADPAGQYPPAGQVRHPDTLVLRLSSTNVPAGHGYRRPPLQYEPGGHSTARDMTFVALVAVAAAVYKPGGTTVGANDPAGQYTVTLPQGSGDTVPAAHTHPRTGDRGTAYTQTQERKASW